MKTVVAKYANKLKPQFEEFYEDWRKRNNRKELLAKLYRASLEEFVEKKEKYLTDEFKMMDII